VRQRFANGNVALFSLSLDDDVSAWQTAMKQHESPWPQGRVAVAEGAGVSSVPAYWILDSAGKILAKCNDPIEVGEFLNKPK